VRILITGSRHWEDELTMLDAFERIAKTHPDVTLVHGDAIGADLMADRLAKTLGWTVEKHPADWKRYKNGAGPIRNQEMVDLGADVCLAFPTPASIGTYNCMEKARPHRQPQRAGCHA
jgi:hypothetical protein